MCSPRLNARAAFAPVRETDVTVMAADTSYDDNSEDDYAGLTHSFARLCRAADAEHASKASNPRAPTFRLAASTLATVDYLIKQNDAGAMRVWLADRSANEVEAIWEHLKS